MRLTRPPLRRSAGPATQTAPTTQIGGMAICAAQPCRNIALQECRRCGQPICNRHAKPVESDRPHRWFEPTRPEWLCYECAEFANLAGMVSDRR